MAQYSDIYKRWVEKQAAVAQIMKAARCWEGYEPVPGKEPYSEDSCRPVGSKKKKTEKKEEKKAANSVFPAQGRPKMVQMPPKPPEPAVAPRKFPPNYKYHSEGQAAAEQAARKAQPPATTLGKAGSLRDAIKLAASTVYKLTEKKDEPVVEGGKPSHEGSKQLAVKRPEPAKSEDLRPEEVQPSKS